MRYLGIFLSIMTILCVNLVNGGAEGTECIQKYTRAEKHALDKFRKAVIPSLYLDYQREDAYLINWLRQKEFDIEAAVEALVNSMRWRKQNNIDNLLKDKETLKLQKNYPTVFGKAVDKEGYLASELAFVQWDIRRAMIAGRRDTMWKLFTFSFEMMTSLARKAGKHQFVSLMNMQGFSPRQHACFACMPLYIDIAMDFENNYPNCVHRYIMINTPGIFDSVSQLIRPLLSQTTRNSTYIFGSNKNDWQPFLLNLFAKEQLPPQFGGTRV